MRRLVSHIPAIEARAILLSIAVGVLLMAVKFAAYFLTGSAAIFSDALESVVNVLASGAALYALSVAHRPPDEQHPYGHGKVEFISAGFEGGLIVLASVVIAVRTVDTLLFHSVRIDQLDIGLVLMAAAMVVNGSVGWTLIRRGKKTGSMTLEADGRHLLSDAITSVAALAALMVVLLTGWAYADPIIALGVAIYLGFVGVSLLRRSSAGLMDEQDLHDNRALQALLEGHVGPQGQPPRICSFHKLRHRHSGRYHWVDFHLMVPARLNVRQGHQIASAIEYEMEQLLGVGNATAHIEPCADSACPSCTVRH